MDSKGQQMKDLAICLSIFLVVGLLYAWDRRTML
jgi:hypothetical protein